MITKRFEARFRRLVNAFVRYHDVPRRPDRVGELASARARLDEARMAMAVERLAVTVPADRDRGSSPRTGVSADDIARLRVFGIGFVGS